MLEWSAGSWAGLAVRERQGLAGWVLPGLLLLGLAGAIAAPAAGAAPEDNARRLKEIERAQKAAEQEKGKLEARAQKLEEELADLRARLLAAAAEVRNQADILTGIETKLAGLAQEEQTRLARIQSDRARMAELLGALERLARLPPEAVIAHPGDPTDTVKSAMLLRSAVPELKARADRLAAELTGLADVRRSLDRERRAAAATRDELARRQADAQVLVAKREEVLTQTEVERDAAAQHLADLAAEASDLRDLMDRLEADRATRMRDRPAEMTRQLTQEAQRQQAVKDKVAALSPSLGKPPLDPKTGAPKSGGPAGGLIMPVAGKVAVRYGEPDRFGSTSRGVTLEARPGEPVVAPYDGNVMFAGPFKGYGLILIVEHANGYHSLVAGLGRIDAQVGQQVLTGEPLGTAAAPGAAADGAPTLYYELRRGGQPINPQRGFAGPEGKGQG